MKTVNFVLDIAVYNKAENGLVLCDFYILDTKKIKVYCHLLLLKLFGS